MTERCGEPDATLLAAWRATEYRVATDNGTLTLRIDQANPLLARLMQDAGVREACYITADNPHSRIGSRTDNTAARQRLRARVHAGGWTSLPGIGIDPKGKHPGEHSLLVLGISRIDALSLGRAFGQDGILLIAADAVPRLALPGPY